MAARTLDELQKQYGGRISDSKKGGMMRGPGPRRGHGGPGVRAKGKPKNTKQTIRKFLMSALPSMRRMKSQQMMVQ